MPVYKYISNRVLTFIQNLCLGQKLSEYHTGYRAFNAEILKTISFQDNSNDFIFDNQLLAQICHKGILIGEISCPAKYEKDSSSINFIRSSIYEYHFLFQEFVSHKHHKGLFWKAFFLHLDEFFQL